MAIIGLASQADGSLWQHLWATVLPAQLRTTLMLMIGIGLTTAAIGTGTAWLVTFCVFPLRRILAIALLLPLAIPTYLAAYAYSDFLDRAGPVYGLWQRWLPDVAYPQFASLGGAVSIMALVLYPYVYLSARAAFVQQSTGLIEAARGLGLSPVHCFLRVALPMARPAIVVGVALALMECLNDIGAVEHLGVRTLTIGIYDTWLVRGNLAGAAQLALMLLALMGLLIVVERGQRPSGRYYLRSGRSRSLPRYSLSRGGQILALLACVLPILLGFFVPVFLLIDYALLGEAPPDMAQATFNSLTLAFAAALTLCLVATFLAYGGRSANGATTQRLARFAALGYAIPGTVLGLGVLIALGHLNTLSGGLVVLGGTVFGLLLAYLVRFLSSAYGTLESGFERISPAMDMAARGLGTARGGVLFRVHVPLLRPAMLAAILLVFVDVMKELPATLILRPFDFETLAGTVYTYASLGQIENASLPALIIVIVGLLPIMFALMLLERAHRDIAKRI